MSRHWTWQYIIDWTMRMANKYGGIVRDKEGFTWDWGQALMREMYGTEWMVHPAFNFENEKNANEPLNQEVVNRAIKWEQGDFPDWWVVPDAIAPNDQDQVRENDRKH